MAPPKTELEKIHAKKRFEELLRVPIKPCRCLSQSGLCFDDYMEFRRASGTKCIFSEDSHDQLIREKLVSSIKSISKNFDYIKFEFIVNLNPTLGNETCKFCRNCFGDLYYIASRTLDTRIAFLKLRLFHERASACNRPRDRFHSTRQKQTPPLFNR
jgi:hypothetical protein